MPASRLYGFTRQLIAVNIPNQVLAGAALDAVTAITPGFAFDFEDMFYVAHTVHTGGGATKTFTLKKGSATVATLVVAVASVGTNGAIVITPTITAANTHFLDTDTLTVSANAGTGYTLGIGTLYIRIKQKPQA